MVWNWTQPGWPHFAYDPAVLEPLERRFLLLTGEVIGAVRYVSDDERDLLRIELLSDEAVKTSAIEGEALDRLSVQSSLRRQLGLDTDNRNVKPKERGIAEMMVDLYRSSADPLDADTLFSWHRMLMADSRHLETVGGYRRHEEAMQIVSGRHDRPTVHFEAPPSSRVSQEMASYLAWFNDSAPGGDNPLPALTRAGIGHLYFESIHPFEDGNGRIGRALVEKSLAQNIGQPILIALAHTIEQHRKAYYDQLEIHQRTLSMSSSRPGLAGTAAAVHPTETELGFASSLPGRAKADFGTQPRTGHRLMRIRAQLVKRARANHSFWLQQRLGLKSGSTRRASAGISVNPHSTSCSVSSRKNWMLLKILPDRLWKTLRAEKGGLRSYLRCKVSGSGQFAIEFL